MRPAMGSAHASHSTLERVASGVAQAGRGLGVDDAFDGNGRWPGAPGVGSGRALGWRVAAGLMSSGVMMTGGAGPETEIVGGETLMVGADETLMDGMGRV